MVSIQSDLRLRVYRDRRLLLYAIAVLAQCLTLLLLLFLTNTLPALLPGRPDFTLTEIAVQ